MLEDKPASEAKGGRLVLDHRISGDGDAYGRKRSHSQMQRYLKGAINKSTSQSRIDFRETRHLVRPLSNARERFLAEFLAPNR